MTPKKGMAVVGQRLYIQGAGTVWCLDTGTGEILWSYPPASDKPKREETTSTPAVADGQVFALNSDGKFLCLDAAKGQLQWSKSVSEFGANAGGWPLSGSPLVLGENAIMDLGVVFILNRKSSALVTKMGSVLLKGCLYGVHGQQGQSSSLKCLDFETGAVKWEQKGLKVGGGLTLADGKLFVMVDGGDLLGAEATPSGFKQLARATVLSAREQAAGPVGQSEGGSGLGHEPWTASSPASAWPSPRCWLGTPPKSRRH